MNFIHKITPDTYNNDKNKFKRKSIDDEQQNNVHSERERGSTNYVNKFKFNNYAHNHRHKNFGFKKGFKHDFNYENKPYRNYRNGNHFVNENGSTSTDQQNNSSSSSSNRRNHSKGRSKSASPVWDEFENDKTEDSKKSLNGSRSTSANRSSVIKNIYSKLQYTKTLPSISYASRIQPKPTETAAIKMEEDLTPPPVNSISEPIAIDNREIDKKIVKNDVKSVKEIEIKGLIKNDSKNVCSFLSDWDQTKDDIMARFSPLSTTPPLNLLSIREASKSPDTDEYLSNWEKDSPITPTKPKMNNIKNIKSFKVDFSAPKGITRLEKLEKISDVNREIVAVGTVDQNDTSAIVKESLKDSESSIPESAIDSGIITPENKFIVEARTPPLPTKICSSLTPPREIQNSHLIPIEPNSPVREISKVVDALDKCIEKDTVLESDTKAKAATEKSPDKKGNLSNLELKNEITTAEMKTDLSVYSDEDYPVKISHEYEAFMNSLMGPVEESNKDSRINSTILHQNKLKTDNLLPSDQKRKLSVSGTSSSSATESSTDSENESSDSSSSNSSSTSSSSSSTTSTDTSTDSTGSSTDTSSVASSNNSKVKKIKKKKSKKTRDSHKRKFENDNSSENENDKKIKLSEDFSLSPSNNDSRTMAANTPLSTPTKILITLPSKKSPTTSLSKNVFEKRNETDIANTDEYSIKSHTQSKSPRSSRERSKRRSRSRSLKTERVHRSSRSQDNSSHWREKSPRYHEKSHKRADKRMRRDERRNDRLSSRSPRRSDRSPRRKRSITPRFERRRPRSPREYSPYRGKDRRDWKRNRDYDEYYRPPSPDEEYGVSSSDNNRYGSPSIESPLAGFKKSLADSTISDAELERYSNYNSEAWKSSTNVHEFFGPPHVGYHGNYLRRNDGTDSPQRVSLDDRINMVLDGPPPSIANNHSHHHFNYTIGPPPQNFNSFPSYPNTTIAPQNINFGILPPFHSYQNANPPVNNNYYGASQHQFPRPQYPLPLHLQHHQPPPIQHPPNIPPIQSPNDFPESLRYRMPYKNNSNLVEFETEHFDSSFAGRTSPRYEHDTSEKPFVVQVGNVLEIVPTKLSPNQLKASPMSQVITKPKLTEEEIKLREEKLELKKKRNEEREKKRAEKRERKEKVKLEIQRLVSLGLKESSSSSEEEMVFDESICHDVPALSVMPDHSILRTEDQVISKKKVMFADGVAPGASTSSASGSSEDEGPEEQEDIGVDDDNDDEEEEETEIDIENRLKRKARKRRKKRLLDKDEKLSDDEYDEEDEEINEILRKEKEEELQLHTKLAAATPPPPPPGSPPPQSLQPRIKSTVPIAFVYFNITPMPPHFDLATFEPPPPEDVSPHQQPQFESLNQQYQQQQRQKFVQLIQQQQQQQQQLQQQQKEQFRLNNINPSRPGLEETLSTPPTSTSKYPIIHSIETIGANTIGSSGAKSAFSSLHEKPPFIINGGINTAIPPSQTSSNVTIVPTIKDSTDAFSFPSAPNTRFDLQPIPKFTDRPPPPIHYPDLNHPMVNNIESVVRDKPIVPIPAKFRSDEQPAYSSLIVIPTIDDLPPQTSTILSNPLNDNSMKTNAIEIESEKTTTMDNLAVETVDSLAPSNSSPDVTRSFETNTNKKELRNSVLIDVDEISKIVASAIETTKSLESLANVEIVELEKNDIKVPTISDIESGMTKSTNSNDENTNSEIALKSTDVIEDMQTNEESPETITEIATNVNIDGGCSTPALKNMNAFEAIQFVKNMENLNFDKISETMNSIRILEAESSGKKAEISENRLLRAFEIKKELILEFSDIDDAIIEEELELSTGDEDMSEGEENATKPETLCESENVNEIEAIEYIDDVEIELPNSSDNENSMEQPDLMIGYHEVANQDEEDVECKMDVDDKMATEDQIENSISSNKMQPNTLNTVISNAAVADIDYYDDIDIT